MRTLVTGAAGFIGFFTTKRLAECGGEIVAIDSINDYYDAELKYARLSELGIDRSAESWGKIVQSSKYPELTFVRMKLEDREGIQRLFVSQKINQVINLAAQAGVRYSLDHPYDYVDSNLVGFINILEACRYNKITHLVYASSSSVYGLNANRPFSTHMNVDHPVSLYAATKKANELMAHSYSYLYNIPTTGLRFFTVYGPWGRPDMAYFKFAAAISDGKPIDIYNGGELWRDFTYIEDIVEGIVRVLNHVPSRNDNWDRTNADPSSSIAPYRIYNIGNSQSVLLSDFVDELERCVGKKALRNYLPMQEGDVYATEADLSDFEETFGWKPNTPLQEGLEFFIKWFKDFHEIPIES